MKRIINSRLMKWFRKSYLEKVMYGILTDKEYFCCDVDCWEKLFIRWPDLKEVKENKNSKYLSNRTIQYGLLNRYHIWFDTKQDRLAFLEECLNKLK